MADIQLAQAVNTLNSTPPSEGSGGNTFGDPITPTPVTNKVRQGWNEYIDYLREKKLAGSPKLDKNDFGMKMIDEYKKDHPDSPISRDMVKPIQQEFARYRDYALKQVDEGNMLLDTHNGVTRDNFLKALSVVDNIPGQRTTSYKFPLGYMKDMNKNEAKGNFLNSNETAQQTLAKTQ